MHARATGDVLLFCKNCMSVLWEGFDRVSPIFHIKIRTGFLARRRVIAICYGLVLAEKRKMGNRQGRLWRLSMVGSTGTYPGAIAVQLGENGFSK